MLGNYFFDFREEESKYKDQFIVKTCSNKDLLNVDVLSQTIYQKRKREQNNIRAKVSAIFLGIGSIFTLIFIILLSLDFTHATWYSLGYAVIIILVVIFANITLSKKNIDKNKEEYQKVVFDCIEKRKEILKTFNIKEKGLNVDVIRQGGTKNYKDSCNLENMYIYFLKDYLCICDYKSIYQIPLKMIKKVELIDENLFLAEASEFTKVRIVNKSVNNNGIVSNENMLVNYWSLSLVDESTKVSYLFFPNYEQAFIHKYFKIH